MNGTSYEVIKSGTRNIQEMSDRIWDMAKSLGSVVKGRAGRDVEFLEAKSQNSAPPRSPSAVVGLGQIDYHQDGAHLQRIPKFLILGALSSTKQSPTLIKPTPKVGHFSEREFSALKTATFSIHNGRRSFYATMWSDREKFFRYDPYCMIPTDSWATYAWSVFNDHIANSDGVAVPLEIGDILVIDNTRSLHARSAHQSIRRRTLLRIAVR